MKLSIVLMIGLSATAWSQKPCVGGEHPNNAPDCIPAEKVFQAQYFTQHPTGTLPAPLKCGKYQHVEQVSACGTGPRPAFAGCSDILHDYCANDLHAVTEKEWQHLADAMRTDEETIRVLMDRVKHLEKQMRGESGSRVLNKEAKSCPTPCCEKRSESLLLCTDTQKDGSCNAWIVELPVHLELPEKLQLPHGTTDPTRLHR